MNNKLTVSLLAFLLNAASAFSQDKISRENAIADIDTLVATLERVHYNPYLHISKQEFNYNVNGIKRSFQDSIPLKDYLLFLYRITGSLEDGHCMPSIVQPGLVPELRKPSFLPIRFVLETEDVYISGADYEMLGIPSGSRIRSINGISLEQAAMEFRAFFGGAGNFKQEMANRLMGYFLFLKGVQLPYKISYASPERNNEIVVSAKSVTFMEMLQRSMPQIGAKNEYRIVENKIAWLSFISMGGDFNKWGEFLDSVFTDIETRKIKTLCIDIRNNSGGNSLFNNFLLAYITKNKFLQSGGKSWKISDDYKRYQQKSGISGSEYEKKESGTIWTYENCTPQENLVTADSIFKGNVYLLTGAFSFSSANMLADAFKTFHLGTLLGEPTGEYTNDFGEVMPIVLPNSKITVQLTTSFETGADCNKKDFHTVKPDVSIIPSLEDKISGRDKILEYILTKYGQ